MATTLHIPSLAQNIAEYIVSKNLQPGTRLPSRKLADVFQVSRTPIDRALQILKQYNIVKESHSGGYEVDYVHENISKVFAENTSNSEEDRIYLQLAGDHTAGKFPNKVSENELIRHYGTNRATIVRVLQRAASEGWTERRPGRGWAFIPLLASEDAYNQLYRYRIVVEPAAMLEPSFVLNRPAIENCLIEHRRIFETAERNLSPIDIFDIGSRFHQTVLDCSNNKFFITGLDQANKIRRLLEYRKTLHSSNWLQRCREHAQIAELLLDDKRKLASQLMRRHLEEGASEKSVTRHL